MTDAEGAAAFAGFREAVFDDFHLALRLRSVVDRETFVARAVAAGAERGFAFGGDAVEAALREGEEAWLMRGAGPR